MIRRILIVADEESIQTSLGRLLARLGNEAVAACDVAEGIRRLQSAPFDLCITDLRSGADALAIVEAGGALIPAVPVVALADHDILDLWDASHDLPARGVDLRLLLTRLEQRLIEQALRRTGGNRHQAAALLRMNRTTLVEKLRRRSVA